MLGFLPMADTLSRLLEKFKPGKAGSAPVQKLIQLGELPLYTVYYS